LGEHRAARGAELAGELLDQGRLLGVCHEPPSQCCVGPGGRPPGTPAFVPAITVLKTTNAPGAGRTGRQPHSVAEAHVHLRGMSVREALRPAPEPSAGPREPASSGLRRLQGYHQKKLRWSMDHRTPSWGDNGPSTT